MHHPAEPTPPRPLPVVAVGQSIRRAAEAIDRGVRGIALVVDAEGRLAGTVTDGDIRRAMLAGVDLDAGVSVLMERKRGAAYERPVTAPAGTPDSAVLALMRARSVRQVPLLDAASRPVGLAVLEDLIDADEAERDRLSMVPRGSGPLTAVVMAGGQGLRLRPLTERTPKPMLPVAGRPLLEHTVERLREAGIGRVRISTNYLAEQIVEHFGDGSRFGVSIEYLRETTPLGTAGSLAMLGGVEGPVLVLNGDILTSVDFDAMRRHHDDHGAAMTVAVRRHKIAVPYGVAECDGALIRSLVEKPTYSVLVNAGMYVVEPAALRLIPAGERFDMTDLIGACRGAGGAVCAFPIREYWLDIGRPEDFERAQRDAASVVTLPPAAGRRVAG